MNSMKKSLLMSLAASVLLGGLAACETTGTSRTETPASQKVGIRIDGPGREVRAGDTATFTANSSNTYGRDVKINWSSTGGRIDTEDKGRIARIKFNDPGTYTVRAMLELDGNTVQTESYDVRVMPVK